MRNWRRESVGNTLMIAEGSSPMHLLTLPANEFVIGTAGDP